MKKVLTYIIISIILVSLAVAISFTSVQSFNNNQTLQKDLNLKIQTVNGTNVYLTDYIGHPLILDLFATWCVPCQEQATLLSHVHNIYPEVTIVSASVDPHDTIAKLQLYKDQNNITWTIGNDIDNKANNLYGSTTLPTIAFFNANGTLKELKHSVATFGEVQSWILNPNSVSKSSTSFYIFGLGISSTLGFPLFFLVGLYVALSPCLFPIMPITILNIMRKDNEKNSDSSNDTVGELDSSNISKGNSSLNWIFMLWSGILFSFGIFALIGAYIGSFLIQNYILFNFIFGVILIVMGYIIVIPKLEEIFFSRIQIPNFIQKQMLKEEYSGFDLFTLGAFYSIIALPCAGPVFIALIPLIISFNNQLISLFSLFLFALGLLIPYLILIFVTAQTQTKFINKVRSSYGLIRGITGVLIIIVGGLLVWPYFNGPVLFTAGFKIFFPF